MREGTYVFFSSAGGFKPRCLYISPCAKQLRGIYFFDGSEQAGSTRERSKPVFRDLWTGHSRHPQAMSSQPKENMTDTQSNSIGFPRTDSVSFAVDKPGLLALHCIVHRSAAGLKCLGRLHVPRACDANDLLLRTPFSGRPRRNTARHSSHSGSCKDTTADLVKEKLLDIGKNLRRCGVLETVFYGLKAKPLTVVR